jgi:hypothetical protein
MRTSSPAQAVAVLAIAAGLLPAAALASGGDDVVLRRDGSKAVPAPANVEPISESALATDGFDWRDAGLGAGVGALVVALGAAGTISLRGYPTGPVPNR